MMRKNILTMAMLMTCGFLLMACSDTNDKGDGTKDSAKDTTQNETNEKADDGTINIPKELILDADADPVEIKDQTGLKIGETGYAGKPFDDGVLAITLNSVESTQSVSESSTLTGDEFYLIGNFTFENVSDETVEIIRPDAVKSSDESAVLNDEFNNGDLLGIGNGIGGAFLNEDGKKPEGTPINTVTVEPGEKIEQKISINMRGHTDEYMVLFGFFDGNNKYYRNKVAWTFDADQLAEE